MGSIPLSPFPESVISRDAEDKPGKVTSRCWKDISLLYVRTDSMGYDIVSRIHILPSGRSN